MCCTRLAEKYRTHKIAILAPLHNFVGLYLRSSKKLLNSDNSPTCPHNTVNFGLLTAAIRWRVWGTPANFNGFHVFVALLHGTLVVGVTKLCSVEQRAPPIFGKATITLGTAPHFLSLWPPYVMGQAIIFLPCGFYLLSSSSFFSSPNLSGPRLDLYHTFTHGVALVRM